MTTKVCGLSVVLLALAAAAAPAKELHVLYDKYHHPVVIHPDWHHWQLGSTLAWKGPPVRELYVCPEGGCNYLGQDYSYQDHGGCCGTWGRGGVGGSLYGRVIEFATPARVQAQREALEAELARTRAALEALEQEVQAAGEGAAAGEPTPATPPSVSPAAGEPQ